MHGFVRKCISSLYHHGNAQYSGQGAVLKLKVRRHLPSHLNMATWPYSIHTSAHYYIDPNTLKAKVSRSFLNPSVLVSSEPGAQRTDIVTLILTPMTVTQTRGRT